MSASMSNQTSSIASHAFFLLPMAFSWARESEQLTESVLTERSITMPFRDGTVDWTTLGNILRSKLLGEVLLASYVDTKHSEKAVDFAVDTDWKHSFEEKGIVVLQKQNTANSNFFCYMGRGVIEAPADEIAEFLATPEAPLTYDHHVVESRHVDTVSQTNNSINIIVYYRSEVTRCLFKTVRDMVFLSSRAKTTCGKHIMSSMSVEYPLCPPVDGVKRAQLQPGCGWLLEPYRGDEMKTLVSYTLQIDLIGMPPVVSNRALKRQPLNIYYLRKHLLESKLRINRSTTLFGSQYTSEEQTSPLNVSGRHFEEPLPINSFTSANAVHTRREALCDNSNCCSSIRFDKMAVAQTKGCGGRDAMGKGGEDRDFVTDTDRRHSRSSHSSADM